MSKPSVKLGSLSQLGLFEMIREEDNKKEPQEGSLNIQVPFRSIVSQCVSQSKHSAYQIAARMSEYLGKDITVNMLYSWTAQSKEDYRIPAEYLPAFCYAVESFKPIEFIAQNTGMFLLPGKDALRSEVQKIEEQIEKLSQEKERRLLFLEQVDKK